MLPNQTLSSPSIPGAFLAPKTGVNHLSAPLVDYCLGGVAIGDASQGLEVQNWSVTVSGGTQVVFIPLSIGLPTVVLTVPGPISWVSGTFDQNMRAFVTYVVAGVAYYYWYDTTIPGYTTSTLPAGVTHPFCSLDDNRSLQSSTSDIILSYVNGPNLYFRAQRDRYTIEYNLGATPSNKLAQAGMSTVNRFQFEFLT